MRLISSKTSDVGFVGDAVDAVRDPEFGLRREGAEGDARRGARGVPQDGRARGDHDQHQVRWRRVGLNLTTANRLIKYVATSTSSKPSNNTHSIDLLWNFATEPQTYDRVHRV